jgi:tungstate transport system ATP-binding protein
MAETLLTLREISVQHGEKTALETLSLEINPGEVVAFVGPNGAGKSTLLRVMGLLQKPSAGKIFFHGEEATPKNSFFMRRRMASVFQEALLLNRTTYENAALGLKLRGLPGDQIETQLCPWLERLGIDHLKLQPARTLSGGEAQRTSLARGLALNPELLLLDEPFSALDAPTREALLLDLQGILTETRITAVLVTHDLNEAVLLGQRIGVLARGRLLQLAPSRDVLARPASQEVAAIVGMETVLTGFSEAAADGMTTVRIKGCTARLPGYFEPGSRVILCIRPEDINISRRPEEQNGLQESIALKATVRRVSPWMAQYRIALQAGDERLVALINKTRFAELGLTEGEAVFISARSSAVHMMISEELPMRHNPSP